MNRRTYGIRGEGYDMDPTFKYEDDPELMVQVAASQVAAALSNNLANVTTCDANPYASSPGSPEWAQARDIRRAEDAKVFGEFGVAKAFAE